MARSGGAEQSIGRKPVQSGNTGPKTR